VPKRAATVPATGITLDPAGQLPMHRQLYQRLRAAILAGQLPPGTRLPSTRSLATELGVSRTTALTAYEQLRDEGYLDGQVGAGTTIAELSGPGPAPPASTHAAPQAPPRPALSARGATMAGDRWRLRPPDSLGAGLRAFPLGLPALDAFPHQVWTRILTRRARRSLDQLLGYQDPAGYRPLREAIAAYLSMARGVRCTPAQIVVVSGAQAGLDLTARLLLDPGDPVWVEDPGYYGARGALACAGARLIPVPVDTDGLDVAAGQRCEPAARLAYVTPSHQFPVGVTMSLPRRLALLAWAKQADAFVLEDDYESEYRYVGRPLPALQGLDEAGRVIYVGSFSKVLFPSLPVELDPTLAWGPLHRRPTPQPHPRARPGAGRAGRLPRRGPPRPPCAPHARPVRRPRRGPDPRDPPAHRRGAGGTRGPRRPAPGRLATHRHRRPRCGRPRG
jgi:GntR family transcriptional regulator / MocR family aminotransferase